MGGTAANIAVYNALLKPGDALIALSHKSGGHFSHGFQTPNGLEAISKRFYNTKHYGVNEDGIIDYDGAYKLAQEHKPKLIICGYSVYSKDLDYKRFREIADSVGAYLHLDMAHMSGMIATKLLNDPFEYIDVATSTTHKTLKGPRGGFIVSKKHLAKAIDDSVFPGIQGGSHNHLIGALAVALKEANSPSFVEYQKQVLSNARTMAQSLQSLRYSVRTGGTDNHMVVWDFSKDNFDTTFFLEAANFASVTFNAIRIKNSATPNAIRIGSMACTTRGYKEQNMRDVVLYLRELHDITLRLKKESNDNLINFKSAIKSDAQLKRIKAEIENYASNFELPGL